MERESFGPVVENHGLFKRDCFHTENNSHAISLKEKAELLRQFISSSESLEATESTLTVSKKQSAEVETGKELLTIRQMVEKGFSQLPNI